MEIKKLKVFNFRNLVEQEINFSEGINLLFGDNAQGKTSVLEAIDLLSRGKSFRTSNLQELITYDQNSVSIFSYIKDAQDFELGLSIQDSKKTAYLNNNKLSSISNLYGRLPTISFNPDDILIIKGSPELRRNLIDKALFETDKRFVKAYLEYKKMLKNKLSLLKSDYFTKDEVIIINKILANFIVEITNSRLRLIEFLNEKVGSIHSKYCNEESIFIELDSKFKDLDIEQVYSLLNQYIDREIASKSCLVGSHRDDLIIYLNDKNAKNFASQGQSRSVILSIKLSILNYLDSKLSSSPIVLLDDVNAELDSNRTKAFFDLILSKKYQIFVTSTEDFFNSHSNLENVTKFVVSSGKIGIFNE